MLKLELLEQDYSLITVIIGLTVDQVELNFDPILFNLEFDLNGGNGNAPATQFLVENTTGIAVENPMRTGYSFKEWNTNKDGSGMTWLLEETLMPAEDVILYAQWTLNDDSESGNQNKPTPDGSDSNMNHNTDSGSLSALPKTGSNTIFAKLTLLMGTLVYCRYLFKRKNQ